MKSSQSKDGPDRKEAHRSFNDSETVKEANRRKWHILQYYTQYHTIELNHHATIN